MPKKIVFKIKDNIYSVMDKYSNFSGVGIPSMIKQAIIEYLVNLKLLTVKMGKEAYKEMKEVKE